MSKKYRFLCTGALAGLTNGLFGAGGGLFLVPLLTRWCGLSERNAFATSVAIIFPLSIGGLIAGHIFKNMKMLWLRRAFGLLILYGGIRAVLLL